MINFHLIPASLVNLYTFSCVIDCCHALSTVVFVSLNCGVFSRIIVCGVFLRDINLHSAIKNCSAVISFTIFKCTAWTVTHVKIHNLTQSVWTAQFYWFFLWASLLVWHLVWSTIVLSAYTTLIYYRFDCSSSLWDPVDIFYLG